VLRYPFCRADLFSPAYVSPSFMTTGPCVLKVTPSTFLFFLYVLGFSFPSDFQVTSLKSQFSELLFHLNHPNCHPPGNFSSPLLFPLRPIFFQFFFLSVQPIVFPLLFLLILRLRRFGFNFFSLPLFPLPHSSC